MDFLLIDGGWDRLIDEAVGAAPAQIRVVSPFIKRRAAERLLQGGSPASIQVITRFNLADFYDGVSDTAALRLLLAHGAKIRGVRDLHAKLYLFGEARAIATSANLTEAALTRNHEFGFTAADAGVVARCRAYFDALWEKAGPDLTPDRLDGWDTRVEAAQAFALPPSQTPPLPDEGTVVDLADAPGLVLGPHLQVRRAFVKFFGSGEDRDPHETRVIDEVRSSGSHWACTYPLGRRPRQVEEGAVVFMGRMVKDPADTLIYGRAVAMRHVEVRDDASPVEIEVRRWKADYPHYIRVHHAEFVAGTLSCGVSLGQMMDELGADAFASTQENASCGRGNTNPRMSLRQKPAVRLSAAGDAWLALRLEDAFRRHGKLSPSELEGLDWPGRTPLAS